MQGSVEFAGTGPFVASRDQIEPGSPRLQHFGVFAIVAAAILALLASLYSASGGDQLEPLLLLILAVSAIATVTALLLHILSDGLSDLAWALQRFARGESYLRLDANSGIQVLRSIATAFNNIADRSEDRESQFALVSEATGDVIWEWRASTDSVTWTGELRKLFGVASDRLEAGSSWWHERVHPQDRDRVEERLAATMNGPARRWSEEYRFRHEDGSYRWFWDRGVLTRDAQNRPMRFIGCMTDISAQREAEERIWQLANHDELTGLPNRKVFHSQLNALTDKPGDGCAGAMLLIDIDHFKDVNDSLGHAAGDALLRTLSARLKGSVGERGEVFRLGGDEFGILLPGLDRRRSVALAQRALAALSEPIAMADRMVAIHATIGVVLVPEHGSDAETLLKNADLALYEGKRRGRSQLVLFEPAFRAALDRRVTLIAEVREAIPEGRFRPHYQPIVSLRTGMVLGVEALMRWEHRDGRLLTPGSFLAVYDDPDLALQLKELLIGHVVADFHGWEAAGAAPNYIAINVSSTFTRLPDAAERILSQLTEGGMPPSRLCIELTETLFFGEHTDKVGLEVQKLHAAGVRIALDDFGTGYASLTHLRRFPVDAIKIDQSFVRSIIDDPGAQAIISAVLELGRRLGKDVIAEGVETAEQTEMLRAAGCRQAQGFLFARPMPPAAFTEFLAMPRSRPEYQRAKAG
jgi:diguanylate cyclase (GGDEF)-like protein/PAS domain S-box-containing protein